MQLLTIEEASDVLKLSRSTLYTYVARKVIPYAKIGSHMRFNVAELENG
jgi:excisionase family DNA binding protein